MRRASVGTKPTTASLATLFVACLMLVSVLSPWVTTAQDPSATVSDIPSDLGETLCEPDRGVAYGTTYVATFAAQGQEPSASSPSMTEQLATDASLTVNVFTGDMRSRVTISNPSGITGAREYQNANFQQSIISQTDTSVELEIATERILDTRAPFPIPADSFPKDVLDYVNPIPGRVQADDPLIVQVAQDLTKDATLQAQAVDAIIGYVRGNTVYDYYGPLDAVSVLETGRAYCVGFANLTEALLRAVGIPARAQYGCVGAWDGWAAPIEGGRHVWVEIYYGDVGWVSCDPQVSANFIDTAHVVGFLNQGGREGTTITRSEYEGNLGMQDAGYLYSVRAPLAAIAGIPLCAPTIPAWDRYPIAVAPTEAVVELCPTSPERWLEVSIDTNTSSSAGWRIQSDVPWMRPDTLEGYSTDTVRVAVDGSAVTPGTHAGSLTIIPTAGDALATATKTVSVTLQMAAPEPTAADAGGASGGAYRICLPVVVRHH